MHPQLNSWKLMLHESASPEERERRWANGLCYYCGDVDSTMSGTQYMEFQKKTLAVSNNIPLANQPISIQVFIEVADEVFPLAALIDSGLDGNFIDQNTATSLQLPLSILYCPGQINTVNGASTGNGLVTHSIIPITLHTSWLHHIRISLMVTKSPKHQIILGLP